MVKNLPASERDLQHGFISGVRKIPWRRAGQHTLVFLPAESQGQKNLGSDNPQDHKESDMTEVT